MLQAPVQLVVPLQAVNQAVQPGQNHLGADPFHAVYAAEKADRRGPGGLAAHLDHPHRQAHVALRHRQYLGHAQVPFPQAYQVVQMQLLGQVAL